MEPHIVRIYIIAVGTKMPDWVTTSYQEYAKRMPHECQFNLIEIPIDKNKQKEGEQMLRAIPKNAYVIALDVLGKSYRSEELSTEMQRWMQSGQDIALLIGGPEGLSPECLQRANAKWSLSTLTFPHPLVRTILAEQLYRAWTILKNLPYHRK